MPLVSNHQLDLRWAAGFCDGEAYLGLVARHTPGRPHPCYRLTLSICQNDRMVLQEVQTILSGGAIYPVRRTIKQNRQVWVLTFDGRHARDAIQLLAPYLRRKNAIAQMCLKAWKQGKLDQHSGPKGWPQQVWKKRAALHQKIKKML